MGERHARVNSRQQPIAPLESYQMVVNRRSQLRGCAAARSWKPWKGATLTWGSSPRCWRTENAKDSNRRPFQTTQPFLLHPHRIYILNRFRHHVPLHRKVSKLWPQAGYNNFKWRFILPREQSSIFSTFAKHFWITFFSQGLCHATVLWGTLCCRTGLASLQWFVKVFFNGPSEREVSEVN